MGIKPAEDDEAEPLIGLIRVSTQKQGESGLGLDAQEADIEAYRKRVGGRLIRTYIEIEIGKYGEIDDRPQLRAAVAHAKRSRATLVIGKLDRLVRSILMLAYLKKLEVKFIACDNPSANEVMIDILVAIAANERRLISRRTKDALKAYKEGKRVSGRIRAIYADRNEEVPDDVVEATAGKLGAELPQCRNLTEGGRRKGLDRSAASRKAAAVGAFADLVPLMRQLRAEGLSLHTIAGRLNADGQSTRRGSAWSATQVKRVLDRAAKKA
jgi:DNA invertase Pin-like site-specific DNA recombinase